MTQARAELSSRVWAVVAGLALLTCTRGFADSLNLRLAGSWPFSGEQAPIGDASRGLAFVGSGGGVYVLDISDPASPQVLSDRIRTLGGVSDLFYEPSTQRLYVSGERAGLSIWDVSSAQSPVRLGQCLTPTHGYRIAVSAGFAYVADRDSGLRILDVSNPANPHQVGRFPTGDDARDIAVADTVAYLGDGGALRMINVANPADPRQISYCDSLVTLGIALADSFVYVVNGYSGLRVVKVADPAHPVRMGRLPPMSYAVDVAVRGHYAFVADNMFGYLVIDVSDPWNPVVVQSMGGGGRFWVSVTDTLCFMLKDNVGIYNISDPPNIHGVGSFRAPRLNGSIAVSGDYAYVGSDMGLRVLNIADLQNIHEVGSYILGNLGCDMAVRGAHLYECNQMPDGLYVFDATDPGDPRLVGSCSVGDIPLRIAVSGSLACIAAQNSVPIVNIARPDSPFVAGRHQGSAGGIAVHDSLAFVAAGLRGLKIVSLSDPANPSEVGSLAIRDCAKDVAVLGHRAYVADRGAGLMIANVQDPTHPHEEGRFPIPSGAKAVAVAAPYVFVADYQSGLIVLDTIDPANPVEVGFYDAAGVEQNIASVRRHIYVAGAALGVRVYENLLYGIADERAYPKAGSRISLQGNPVQAGRMEIRLRITQESNVIFHLLDCAGRRVLDFSAGRLSSGDHVLSIPVSVVRTGVYFLSSTPALGARLKVVVSE